MAHTDYLTERRTLRPFPRLSRATADGVIGGTTIVSLWDPTVPEGLNEPNGYWNDGQVRILSGDMTNQVREITGFVQATGVITVAPRFTNPNVTLLTVNSPIGDVVIDVADATVFTDTLLAADVALGAAVILVADATQLRAGAAVIFDNTGASEAILILAVAPATNVVVVAAPLGATYTVANAAGIVMAAAYIFDTAPNAEALVITGIDQTLNQLTVQAPGCVAGYTLANAAAISISPMILDDVQFVLQAPNVPHGSADVSLQQTTPADALTPADSLEVTGFAMVYDVNADDWNRWREGAQVGVPMVEDTGLNTNPRRYEKDNGFRSAVVARAGGVATALWTIATAPARTAGQITTVYTLEIENATGAPITAWLEIGGVAVTVPIHVANLDSAFIDFPAGKTMGDNDINCNASVNAVIFAISGTEE